MIFRLWQYRDLIQELAKREFAAKYKGSVGGCLWAILQPLLTLSVYTLTFGLILQAKGAPVRDTTDFALWLFAGLIIFNAFSEVSNKSVSLIVGNPNFVKKIVFPLELLSVVSVISTLSHLVIGLLVWLAIYFFVNGGIPYYAIYSVPIVLSLVPLFLGISWVLATLAVFARDVIQVVAMVSQALLFLSPVFYSVDQAPDWIGRVLLVNPLVVPIEQLRLALLDNEGPEILIVGVYSLFVVLFAFFSYLFFSRAKSQFGDMV